MPKMNEAKIDLTIGNVLDHFNKADGAKYLNKLREFMQIGDAIRFNTSTWEIIDFTMNENLDPFVVSFKQGQNLTVTMRKR